MSESPTEPAELPPFAVSDPDLWSELRTKVDVNWYGNQIVRFAALWASKMDADIANGMPVRAAAEKNAGVAEAEIGVTANFVFGYAIELLGRVWKHGAELKVFYGI